MKIILFWLLGIFYMLTLLSGTVATIVRKATGNPNHKFVNILDHILVASLIISMSIALVASNVFLRSGL